MNLAFKIARRIIPERVRIAINVAMWRRIRPNWILSSGYRIEIASVSDWGIYSEVFVNGDYDEAIRSALSAAPDNRPLRVVDLGANVGFFTLRVLHLAALRNRTADIIAVEGAPSVARELRARLAGQPPFGGTVRVIDGLVGLRKGLGKISENVYSGVNSAVAPSRSSQDVPYIDLTHYVSGSLDLLKCDIEGSEQAFLENYHELMINTAVATFEIHPELCDAARCSALLKDAGLVPSRDVATAGMPAVYHAQRSK